MVSKEEEEQQLRRKLEDLEGTVQRLNGRLEKNQKEHETELRSTQNLLETIKSSGSQTQILLQRVQTDLEIARKDCKKYEKKKNIAEEKNWLNYRNSWKNWRSNHKTNFVIYTDIHLI